MHDTAFPPEEPDHSAAHASRKAATRRTWLIILALFVLINGGAILGPLLYFQKDRQRLEQIQADLSARQANLRGEETRLLRMREGVDRLRAQSAPLQKRVRDVEARYPKGIPGGDIYQGYLKTVREYNAKAAEQNRLAAEYRTGLEAYRARVQEYNVLGDEANGIARKIRSAWSVVPVPLPSPAAPVAEPSPSPSNETPSGATVIGVQ